MNKKEKTMDNFGGFDSASEIDFFGETPDGGSAVDTTKETTKDEAEEESADDQDVTTLDEEGNPSPPKETAKDEEEETEDDDFFGSTDIDEDEAEGDEEEPKKKTGNEVPVGKNVSFLEQLKERGLADYELEEGEELTDERAGELIEDSYESGLESRLSELLESLPPVTRDLVKFASKGGNESEFLAKVGKQPSATSISKDMDMSEEKNQEAVIKAQLQADDHDEEYIDAQLEFLKDSGKLESLSKKYHGKILARDEAARAADLKSVEDRKKAMKENARNFKSTIASHLKTNKEIKGFSFNDKDANDLPSYIGDSNIKTDSGQQISAFQRDLFTALQDKDNSILLAKLVQSDFDFSQIANKSKTNQTKRIQEDVRRAKTTTAKSSGSSRTQSRKSLADLLGD